MNAPITAETVASNFDKAYRATCFGAAGRTCPKPKSYFKNKLKRTIERGNTAILCSAYRKSGENVNFCDLHVFVVDGVHCRWLMWAGRVDRGRVKQLEDDGLIHAVHGTNNLWKEFDMDPIKLSAILQNTRKWLEP